MLLLFAVCGPWDSTVIRKTKSIPTQWRKKEKTSGKLFLWKSVYVAIFIFGQFYLWLWLGKIRMLTFMSVFCACVCERLESVALQSGPFCLLYRWSFRASLGRAYPKWNIQRNKTHHRLSAFCHARSPFTDRPVPIAYQLFFPPSFSCSLFLSDSHTCRAH